MSHLLTHSYMYSSMPWYQLAWPVIWIWSSPLQQQQQQHHYLHCFWFVFFFLCGLYGCDMFLNDVTSKPNLCNPYLQLGEICYCNSKTGVHRHTCSPTVTSTTRYKKSIFIFVSSHYKQQLNMPQLNTFSELLHKPCRFAFMGHSMFFAASFFLGFFFFQYKCSIVLCLDALFLIFLKFLLTLALYLS